MQIFELTLGGHQWEKQNLVTLGQKKSYDLYKCKRCGITGKVYTLGYITIKEADVKKMQKCLDKGHKKSTFKQIRVVNCRAVGPQFQNMIPGSIHNIVPPPSGQSSERGEWVMGAGEPILLLAGEYTYIDAEDSSKK